MTPVDYFADRPIRYRKTGWMWTIAIIGLISPFVALRAGGALLAPAAVALVVEGYELTQKPRPAVETAGIVLILIGTVLASGIAAAELAGMFH